MAFASKHKNKKEKKNGGIFGSLFNNSVKNDDNIDRAKKSKAGINEADNLEEIEAMFASLRRELGEYVIGQDAYLDALCVAFERPYLYENHKSYSNLALVLGPEGSGRYYAMKVAAVLLFNKKVLKNADIYNLNFNAYDTQEHAEKLLFPDLYKAFYGRPEIVVIHDFDKGCESAEECIISLVKDGVIKSIDKRFNWNKGNLQEAAGTYSMSTTNNLSANGKYIFLLSNKSKEDIQSSYPVSFLNEITDVMCTVPLAKEGMNEILKSFFEDLSDKLNESLHMTLHYENIITTIIDSYDTKKGAGRLEELVEKRIYNAIVDLLLKKKISQSENIYLDIYNGYLNVNEIPAFRLSQGINEELLASAHSELDGLVGLTNVKKFLKDIELQARYAFTQGDSKEKHVSWHMIFTGNPGTGKTTVARITAKILRALGALSSGHMIEATRGDLIGQYVGETSQKTKQVIQKAVGGVLFIDEAYSLSHGKEDPYGQEAVDTIVKYMEDYRNDLVVILAGYTKEMNDFLSTNSGLQSRFNHAVEFPDYTADELCEITKRIANSRKYSIEDESIPLLKKYYQNETKRLGNEAGNGRMARNLVETAVINYSRRVMQNGGKEDTRILTSNDLQIADVGKNREIDEKALQSVYSELQNIVGLTSVKEFLKQLENQIRFERKRNEDGKLGLSLHMAFLGNPGTGKTTIARILAKMMKALGCLSKGQLIETSRSGLVGQYVGETAQKTQGVIEQAKGGILFIDEAYAIARDKNDQFGVEAVDTLVKYMEDYRDDLIVVLAGYTEEMNKFISTNPGLSSRINYKIEFPDYSGEELFTISKNIAKSKGYSILDNCRDELIGFFEQKQHQQKNESGNGRLARNTVEKAILNHSTAYTDGKIPEEQINTLQLKDFGIVEKRQADKSFDLEYEFSQIIGMDEVKNFIRGIYKLARLNQARKKMGLPSGQSQTLHMIFEGNPGTGKTTFARIVGKMLHSIGALSTDKVIETDRAGLVAGYVGQTAIKTKDVINSAMNGVLFIDEAYSLIDSTRSGNDFGREAIDTLLKAMEDNRDRLVVILAGYTNNMQEFLDSNPGLASRFPNVIEFKDYSTEELIGIAKLMLKKMGYFLTSDAEILLKDVLNAARQEKNFGNGRYVRNICEKLIRNLSSRVIDEADLTPELLSTITIDDVIHLGVNKEASKQE